MGWTHQKQSSSVPDQATLICLHLSVKWNSFLPPLPSTLLTEDASPGGKESSSLIFTPWSHYLNTDKNTTTTAGAPHVDRAPQLHPVLAQRMGPGGLWKLAFFCLFPPKKIYFLKIYQTRKGSPWPGHFWVLPLSLFFSKVPHILPSSSFLPTGLSVLGHK